MNGLEIAVMLGGVLLVGGTLAAHLRVNPPLVLLGIGGLLGFLPAVGDVELDPNLVLLLFLPALLYWESLNTSLREIRRNLRVIALSAVPLVLVTAGAVAVLGHAFGLPWSVSIALGAILAPTDATAVAAVAARMPRRTDTILRAESLINDGTALAVYAVAVAAAIAERPINLGDGTLRFLASYAGGIVIGFVIAGLVVVVRRVVPDRSLTNTLSVLTPFLAYLPAEVLGVSGVVAVVTCGLVLSYFGPRIVTASARTQMYSFWQLTTYVLNGSLFVLIGIEIHGVILSVDNQWRPALALGVLAALVVIVVRLAWVNTTPYLIRALDRRPSQRARRVSARHRFPIAWAGFRGAVSLAAALALPKTVAGGAPFPGRNLIIAVTIIVILVTLTLQGTTMGAVVRWAKLPEDPTEADEQKLAESAGLTAMLEALPDAAERARASDEVRDLLRSEYSERLEQLRAGGVEREREAEERETDSEDRLRLQLLSVKRAAVIGLRDRNEIDDTVLRHVQSHIDLEELRLTRAVDEG